ncbi:LCP family protein [Actinokineospora sp. G85]|uniref:LCP family protein n=1 Tax=Actinokineospora sp. G85 TaxID=3406626 RepID=UPI003C736F80
MDERAQVVDDLGDPGGSGERASGSRWLLAGSALVKSLAAVVSAAVVVGTGYGWWTFGDIDDGTATTDVIDARPGDTGPVPLDGAVDILLVGIDSRTDSFGNPLPQEVLSMLNGGKADGERNTDTMILVHIPVDGRRAVAFSFPRDSWVDIGAGFGKHKLNSAFVYAYNDARKTLVEQGVSEAEAEKQATVAGRRNLLSSVERLVGGAVTIDRYAEVNLASFYEVTKAIGGVDVCLNNAVREIRSGADFPAGRQSVSGKQALSFVRQRYGLPNGDLDRIVRQQAFLASLANKVLSAEMLTDPSKARQLVEAVQKSVVLSSNWNLSTFASQMQGLSGGDIDFVTIPNHGDAKIGGADVIKVVPEEVAAFVRERTEFVDDKAETTTGGSVAASDPPSAPPSTSPATLDVRVDVRNGSNTGGIATTALNALVAAGYTAGEVGDSTVRTSSVIQHAPGDLAKAQAVGAALGSTFGYEENAALTTDRVLVVLGTTYRAGATTDDSGGLFSSQHSPVGTTSSVVTSSSAPPPVTIDAGSVPCVN